MNESIHQCAKVSLVHFMAYPSTIRGEGPIEETVRKIALDDYFDAIEISWIKDPETRAKVKKILASSHLSVAYGGQPRLLTTGQNINSLDETERNIALANLKEGIDEAYELGAGGFGFLAGKYTEDTKEEAYQALVKSTKEICAEFDNFGLMVDLSHIPIIHETMRESLLPVKDYIIHAHMGNGMMKDKTDPAYGDNHPRFGYPGGENDVEELVEYLRILLEIGYLNPENPRFLSFEVKPVGDEDPDLVVANAKRTLNLAWARL